jgi:hypothetical protein
LKLLSVRERKLVAKLVAGELSGNDAQKELAALAAIDLAVDALEKDTLGD